MCSGEALAECLFSAVDLQVSLTLPLNEAVKSDVEVGVSAVAVSKIVVDTNMKASRLFSWSIDLATRHFFVVHDKETYISRTKLALTSQLRYWA
jgi:hypothetical protein